MKLEISAWHTGFSKARIVFEYRFDPVPGIHKFRKCARKWYRRIDCMDEKRAWFNAEGLGRVSRSPWNLPDAWDDRPVAKDLIRSWKRTKKRKQYL